MSAAIIYQDEKPCLELSAQEWVFPILTPDERSVVLFHVKPYRPFSVKKFYDEIVYPRRERKGSELIFKTPDFTEAKKFVDTHFLKMSGVCLPDGSEPSLEQQRAFLEDHPDFKMSIFRNGYDGHFVPETNGHYGNGHKLVLFQVSDHKIVTRWKLYSPEKSEVVNLETTHHLARITQNERHRYNQAMHLNENTRRGEQYITTNWDVVEQLYDEKITKVDGIVLEGAPCDEFSKKLWFPLVPFCMKAFVVSVAFQEIELKNV